MTAVASVDIDLPAEAVWRAVTAWHEQGRWMPMTSVEVVAGDGGLGTRLRARTGAGPLAVVDEMEVDVWDPPHRAEVRHLGRIVTGRGVFTVDPLPGDRARVSWTEAPRADSLVGRFGGLADAPVRAMLGLALRRLRPIAGRLG